MGREIDDETRELAEKLVLRLEENHERNYDSAYIYEGSEQFGPDWGGKVGIDGIVDAFELVELLRFGIPHPGTEIPPPAPERGEGISVNVLAQDENDELIMLFFDEESIKNYSGSTGWSTSDEQVFVPRPKCWWLLPRARTDKELAEIFSPPAPEDSRDTQDEDNGEWHGECPKCRETSGNDWSQCRGSCPIPDSPHYNATEALRRILRPAKKVD